MPKFDPLEVFDGWELEEKLAHVRRILDQSPGNHDRPARFRLDRQEAGVAQTLSTFYDAPVAWTAAKLAVSAITCGGILAAWWWIAGRHDLIKPALASLAIGHLTWLGKWWWETRNTISA